MYANFDSYPNLNMDYITSRKLVYVPEYFNLTKNKSMVKYWKKQLDKGNNITIYDFDGPRLNNGDPTCIEITIDNLINKINDTSYPFGHGYVVGAILLDIEPNKFC